MVINNSMSNLEPKQYQELAIFGDSYADSNIHSDFALGWAHYLCDINGWNIETDAVQTGLSGAGNWWAYSQFCKALDNYHIKNAVFVFTDTGRLPIATLTPDITPSVSFLSNIYDTIDQQDSTPMFGPGATFNEYQVIKMWREVFTDDQRYDLLEWINRSCARDCIQLAIKNQINFTVVVPFQFSMRNYNDILQPDQHQIITGVDTVSLAEMQLHNPDVAGVDWGENIYDTRTNHLNNHNNKILASLIQQGLSGGKGVIDFSERDDLDTSPETLQQYGTILFK